MKIEYTPPTRSEGVIPLEFILATPAKVVCSALFLSGRDLEEVRKTSFIHALVVHHMHEVLPDLIDITVDKEAHTVMMSLTPSEDNVDHIIDGYREFYREFSEFDADWSAERERLVALGTVSRTAKLISEDLGSAILPLDGRPLGYEPVSVKTALPAADTEAWPNGDVVNWNAIPAGVQARFAEAVDAGFADPDAHTAAVVVVHKGELVAERYRPGIASDTQLESWSMGKSITAALIGVLIQERRLSLNEPAPVPEWHAQDGDPRAEITLRDLLQMSSGLKFQGQQSPRQNWVMGVPDHLYVYADVVNSFSYAVSHGLEFPPGTSGRYLNCDPLTLGYIVKRTVESLGEEYLSWPQRALFDRIGVRRQVLEPDWYGNYLLTGFDYGTARNWARFGLLHLQNGVWGGEQVLPEWWSDFVSSHGPGWDEPRYGGQFWLNGTGEFALPKSTYMAAGFGEQRTFVVPSHDLVIVRMGHRADTPATRESTNRMLGKILEAAEKA